MRPRFIDPRPFAALVLVGVATSLLTLPFVYVNLIY
jgi:hypothetical protein